MTAPTKRWVWWVTTILTVWLVPVAVIVYWFVNDEGWIGTIRTIAHDWWDEVRYVPWKERPL